MENRPEYMPGAPPRAPKIVHDVIDTWNLSDGTTVTCETDEASGAMAVTVEHANGRGE